MKLFIIIIFFLNVDFYSLPFTSFDGKKIDLSNLKGKKVLVVNIASTGKRVNQLAQLRELLLRNEGRLELILIPTSSFTPDTKTDQAIGNMLRSTYRLNCLVSKRSSANGSDMHPIFKWFNSQAENGEGSQAVAGDFQKFMIDGTGKFIGAFSGMISPLDSIIQETIDNN